MSASTSSAEQPGAEAHKVNVTVAFAITPAGLASYASAHGFGASPAEHARALEHFARQLPGYVSDGLYRVPALQPAIWAISLAEVPS